MSSAVKLASARTVGVFFQYPVEDDEPAQLTRLAGYARDRVICPLRHPSEP